jgi:hypothetical protein
MSALTTFLSRIACLFSTFALVGAIPSSVLYQTLPRELPKHIFLKQNAKKIFPRIPKSMSNPVS